MREVSPLLVILSVCVLDCLLMRACQAIIPLEVDVEYTLDRQYPIPLIPQPTLDPSLLSLMAQHHVSGLAAAVVSKGRILWTGGYGWKNISTASPYSVSSLIRIASISKQITAIATMQLLEKGTITSLDDDVSDYLGFTLRNPFHPTIPVTLRSLLDHTSSIHDYYIDFVSDCYTQKGPFMNIQDLLLPGGKYYNETELWATKTYPGDPNGYEYSNTNPLIMATVVELLSGERFDRYVSRHIFTPLEMARSSFNLYDFNEEEGRYDLSAIYEHFYAESPSTKPGYYIAKAGFDDPTTYQTIHTPNGRIAYEKYDIGTNGALFGPQGSLRTDVGDLARLMLMHLGNGSITASDGTTRTILKPDSIEQMHSVQVSGSEKYGLYQEIAEDIIPGQTLFGHAGDAYGFKGFFFGSMKQQWGIILCSNGWDGQTVGPQEWPKMLYDTFNLLHTYFSLGN